MVASMEAWDWGAAGAIEGAFAVEYLRAWTGRIRFGMLRRITKREPWTLSKLRIIIL